MHSGAGQAGLTVGARLKSFGVKSLIIDTAKHVGDSWRERYDNLTLHDSVYFSHMPYLPFPATWPIFMPKDKFADWLQAYAQIMDLTVWNDTRLESAQWSGETKSWLVKITRRQVEGTAISRTFQVNVSLQYHLHKDVTDAIKHLIQATGVSGEPNLPTNLPGFETFSGSKIIHSSQFRSALPSHNQNKRAIIVGSCNSAHDIAQNCYLNGYDVTMIQRSPTIVHAANSAHTTLSSLYGEDSPPIEDADLMLVSLPSSVLRVINAVSTKVQDQLDEQMLQGLKRVGFRLDNDEGGMIMKYLQRGGGYHLDLGSSQFVIDGKVKLKHGGVIEVVPNGVKLDNGETVEGDEIIFATGYRNMTTTTAKILGSAVADKVNSVWGLDEEGEIRTLWRKSGHPGLWMMGGTLVLCRYFSRVLALQITGLEAGLYNYDDI